jgi:hypothetical protein
MAKLSRDYNVFSPMGSQSSLGIKINFDGLLTVSNGDRSTGIEREYVQLFRNGIVEASDSLYVRHLAEPLINVA